MSNLQRQVIEFHRVFDHPIRESPGVPADERVKLRAGLIVEEALEFVEACFDTNHHEHASLGSATMLANARRALKLLIDEGCVKGDLAKVADALADIDYVVEGSRLEFGIDGDPIAREVHRANMTKRGGGKRVDGKTTKPEGWLGPNIAGELARQSADPDECGLRGVLVDLSVAEYVTGKGIVSRDPGGCDE